MMHFPKLLVAGIVLTFASLAAHAQWGLPGQFQLHSRTLENGQTMPLSTVLNNPTNGVNSCTANGEAGGDQSPDLYWTGAPFGTQSYAVVLYDVTAGFTHWGIYNVKGDLNGLPAGAGVAGSRYGTQIMNDFYLGAEYDGPCPPANVAPEAHEYVFTVYALSTKIEVPSSTNFPANAEALFHALLHASQRGQLLAQSSLVGYFSSTPAR